MTHPVYKFELKSEDDFSPAEDFVEIKYQTKDSLSLKFYAIQLYQQLIAFHLDDKEKDALIDVDLARINFVRNTVLILKRIACTFLPLSKWKKNSVMFLTLH